MPVRISAIDRSLGPLRNAATVSSCKYPALPASFRYRSGTTMPALSDRLPVSLPMPLRLAVPVPERLRVGPGLALAVPVEPLPVAGSYDWDEDKLRVQVVEFNSTSISYNIVYTRTLTSVLIFALRHGVSG
jgi:hypothetical protein